METGRPRQPTQELSDEALMQQYMTGDGLAFEELFRRYEKRAFSYFAKRTHSLDRAQDLYQELFFRIHRSRHAYDARLPFAPWFFQVAHRLLIDDLRLAYRRQEVSLEGSPAGVSVSVESDGVADREHLSRLLDCLTEADQHLLFAAKIGGVGYAELAVEQGKSVAAVKKAISRALKRMRSGSLVEAAAGLRGD